MKQVFFSPQEKSAHETIFWPTHETSAHKTMFLCSRNGCSRKAINPVPGTLDFLCDALMSYYLT